MALWSKRRKFIYGGSATLLVFALFGYIGFALFYKAPSCNDGIRNGNEEGVDCGGSCIRLCQNYFAPAIVSWTRFEQVAPGLYNVAAYIKNPNTEGEALKVPYAMSIYDNTGLLISSFRSTVNIPPHRDVLAFRPSISLGKSIPAKISFEFLAPPDWNKKTDQLKALKIENKDYREEANSSTLLVTLKNSSAHELPRMSVYAVLKDGGGNAIGFSKTIIDGIGPYAETIAPFTWPVSRNGRVISIEVLPVAE